MSECKHERIRVFYNAETGEAVSLWACTECDYRFVPIAEAESLRAENERLSQDAERWRYYERHYGGADLQEKVDAAMSAEQRR